MMSHALALALVVPTLALSACGSGDRSPVEGTTTPTSTTGKPSGRTIKDQIASLKSCTGNKKKGMIAAFAPTVKFARDQGGDATAVSVGGSGVELIAFPSAGVAGQGFKDAQDQLIGLQQTQPAKFAKLSGAALEVQQNVLVIAPKGGLKPAAGTKLTTCITASLKG